MRILGIMATLNLNFQISFLLSAVKLGLFVFEGFYVLMTLSTFFDPGITKQTWFEVIYDFLI